MKLRLPPDLMEKIRAAAEEAHRPTSSEIVARLENSFRRPNLHIHMADDPLSKTGIGKRLAYLEEKVAQLLAKMGS